MPIHQSENTVDQRLPSGIAEFAQRDAAAEVLVAVGLAPRAAQGTFTGDFDREVRTVASEYLAPCANDTFHAE